MARCAIVSFRLGMTDGVSIVAGNWAASLERLGFDVVTVAGEGPVDRTIAGLGIESAQPPRAGAVRAALGDADLVVVENLCTIPLNVAATEVVAAELEGRAAVLHHHDPPWQRRRFANLTDLPPTDPAWAHVTINKLTEAEFAERGIDARCIYNGFDTDRTSGDRDRTRDTIGLAPDELVFAHPVRAIQRKGIPQALRLAEALNATYWLLGEPEEGYGAELDRLVDAADCRVVRAPLPHGPDIYAAPDAVLFPSTWEGFGNPPIEASIHHRPVAVGPYPVGRELAALGFVWFDAGQPDQLGAFLADPDPAILASNADLAAQHFSNEVIHEQITELLDARGWLP